jgi:uncharacterized protein
VLKPPKTIIDFHVHLFPDKGFDAIWNFFAAAGVDVLYKYYTDRCIEYLRSCGVGPIVFSNYAHKQGVAEPMNQWNINLLEKYDDLYCFVPYHPDDDNALKYTEQMLAHPRVAGVKMHFQVQQFYPHDKRLFPLYEMVAHLNKRLLLHVGNGPTGNEYVGFDQFKKVLECFPDLPANIPHMGCYEFEKFIDLLDAHPKLYLDTAYSFWPGLPFTFNLGPEYLEKYKDRILYGSDFPNVILPREGEIEHLLSFDLSKDVYDRIFYKNGIRLLNEVCPLAVHNA